MTDKNIEQRYGLWIDADDYERITPYSDGDVSLEVTEEQAQRLVEKFGRCTSAEGDDE